MVSLLILIYILLMIPLGIYASRHIKTSGDYILAGRRLPFIMVTATVFATWFGSESLMGTGSRIAEGGFLSVIEDPFAASLCLIIIGFFFAKKLYKQNNFTIGDYFHQRYNKTVATILSLIIIVTYFGWIAAQFIALGAAINMIFGISAINGMILASIIIVTYTYLGGMKSVSFIDTVQAAVIIVGLFVILVEVLLKTGGISTIFAGTPSDFFRITPQAGTAKDWLAWIAVWVTIGLGSIPQQDVYQRILSSKSAIVAKWSSISGGVLYFIIALIPLTLGLIARIKYPELVISDPKQLLPTLILNNTSIVTQVFFFGALLSAVMSTASGAILAPATLLGENVIKPFISNLTDKTHIRMTRFAIIFIALCSLLLASSQGSIYALIVEATSITLVSAFVPLVMGLYSHKANSLGALCAIFFGAAGWQFTLHYVLNPIIPATLVGLALSFAGMFIGIVLERQIHHKIERHRMQIEKGHRTY